MPDQLQTVPEQPGLNNVQVEGAELQVDPPAETVQQTVQNNHNQPHLNTHCNSVVIVRRYTPGPFDNGTHWLSDFWSTLDAEIDDMAMALSIPGTRTNNPIALSASTLPHSNLSHVPIVHRWFSKPPNQQAATFVCKHHDDVLRHFAQSNLLQGEQLLLAESLTHVGLHLPHQIVRSDLLQTLEMLDAAEEILQLLRSSVNLEMDERLRLRAMNRRD